MAWRNDTTCDSVDEAKQELATALRNVGLRRKAKYILQPIGRRSTLLACIVGTLYLYIQQIQDRPHHPPERPQV